MPWRTGGGDRTRRGFYPFPVRHESNPSSLLLAQGAVQTSAVFDDKDNAFIADMAGGVQSFDKERKERWRIRLDGGVSATPTLAPNDRRLFVGTHTGRIFSLNTDTGDILWMQDIPTKSDSRILSDLLYLPKTNALVLSSWGEKFVALDADSGGTLFSWDAGISPYSGASADREDTIYCLRSVWDKGVQFVTVSPQGEETILFTQALQKKPASRIPVSSAPVLDEDRGIVYFITNLDRESLIHAWQIQSSKILWNYRFPRNIVATPALTKKGVLIVPALDGYVYSLSPEGQLLYRYLSGCEYLLGSAVVDAQEHVWFGDPLGMVHRIEETGIGFLFFEGERALLARPSFDKTGCLFVPSTDRRVFVFNNMNG